jgi:hypothetical protein
VWCVVRAASQRDGRLGSASVWCALLLCRVRTRARGRQNAIAR